MRTKNELLSYIKNAPAPVTNIDIANAFGLQSASVAGRTKKMLEQGLVTREIVRSTASGVKVYGYRAADLEDVAPTVTRRVATKATKANGSNDIAGLIDQLASSIVDQIVTRAKSQLQIELTRLLPEQVDRQLPILVETLPTAEQVIARAAEASAPVQPKVKKQKVLVMCLLPRQAGQIQAEFHDTFDLLFWNDKTGDSKDRLKTLARSAEVVFNHVEHCSHVYEDLVQSVGARLIRVKGGVSQMRDALTKYYVEEVAS